MMRPVFTLTLLLAVACGSSKNKSESAPTDAELARAKQLKAEPASRAVLRELYEIEELESGDKVGMVYKRDHGNGRLVSWVYDGKGRRRGYITEDNRGFAYDLVAGQRSPEAYFVANDTPTALARRIIGSTRAVKLNKLDIRKWAEQGYVEKGGKLDEE